MTIFSDFCLNFEEFHQATKLVKNHNMIIVFGLCTQDKYFAIIIGHNTILERINIY